MIDELLITDWIPDSASVPLLVAFERDSLTPFGSSANSDVVAARPTMRVFDVSGYFPETGDYDLRIYDPTYGYEGSYVVRVTDTENIVAGSWLEIEGGGSLTQQQIRDAMKLAPTAGAAATGSLDAKINSVGTPIQVGTEYLWSNQSADTMRVTIDEVP